MSNDETSVTLALDALWKAAEELRSEVPEVDPEAAQATLNRINETIDLLRDCADLAELQAEEASPEVPPTLGFDGSQEEWDRVVAVGTPRLVPTTYQQWAELPNIGGGLHPLDDPNSGA